MKDSFTEINIVPLVDVMLVVIVMLLMTASFVSSGQLPISLPEAPHAQKAVAGHTVTLEMDASGTLSIDAKPVAADELEALLQPMERDAAILVRADSRASVGDFISLVDRLKKMRFTRINVETRT